jgi:NTE family protein
MKKSARIGCAKPIIGVALGGGFARGIAHIGVLRVFERNGIPVDRITGVSAGAIVAGAMRAAPDWTSLLISPSG